MRNFLKILSVGKESMTPLYHQIFNSIKTGIEDGVVDHGDMLPSINDLCLALDISKNTTEKAYKLLKKNGMLTSVPGKGFFIINPQLICRKKILLLFNKISAHKKVIYDAFVNVMHGNATIDLCVYNNDIRELSKLVDEKLFCYHTFVIIPPFIKNDDLIYDIIKKIPSDQLYILDRHLQYKEFYRGAVYQDFEKDIYTSLSSIRERLEKYDNLKIVFPADTAHAVEILNGFIKFCKKNGFAFCTILDIEKEDISKGTAYISLMEDDLVILVEKIQKSGLQPGVDIGIISYNETPLKRMILNGLTTISTDFKFMGETMANLILNNSKEQLAAPFHTICRNSI